MPRRIQRVSPRSAKRSVGLPKQPMRWIRSAVLSKVTATPLWSQGEFGLLPLELCSRWRVAETRGGLHDRSVTGSVRTAVLHAMPAHPRRCP